MPGRGDIRRRRCPADQQQFTALNAELAKVWKPIIERKPAPPDADEWKDVKDKLPQLER
jgi:ferredoxin